MVPIHPGILLRDQVCTPLGLSPELAAERTGISACEIRALLCASMSITPDIARKLELAGFGRAAAWLHLQRQFDVAMHSDAA